MVCATQNGFERTAVWDCVIAPPALVEAEQLTRHVGEVPGWFEGGVQKTDYSKPRP
jgi:hypothetical protein